MREFLSIAETMDLLRSSRATVMRRIDDGTLTAVKIGRRRLVVVASVKRALGTDNTEK